MAREIKFRQYINGKIVFSGTTFSDGSFSTPNIATDKYPLMQFTGLTDKNGKAIYEGDVIAYVFDDGKSVGEVVFKDAGFIVEWKNAAWLSEKITAHLDIAVVIGNIYEKPELLEANHD